MFLNYIYMRHISKWDFYFNNITTCFAFGLTMKLCYIAQDWGEHIGQPREGPCRGERLWGRSTEQPGSTPTQLHWDARTRRRAAAKGETGPCWGFGETNPEQHWSEERRGEEPREIPPQNTPLMDRNLPTCNKSDCVLNYYTMWCVQKLERGSFSSGEVMMLWLLKPFVLPLLTSMKDVRNDSSSDYITNNWSNVRKISCLTTLVSPDLFFLMLPILYKKPHMNMCAHKTYVPHLSWVQALVWDQKHTSVHSELLESSRCACDKTVRVESVTSSCLLCQVVCS